MGTIRNATPALGGLPLRGRPARSPSSRPGSAPTTSPGPRARTSRTAGRAPRSSSPRRTRRATRWRSRTASRKAGTPPTTLDTKAAVTFVPGTGITEIALSVIGDVPGITAEQFEAAAAGRQGELPGQPGAQGRADHPRGHFTDDLHRPDDDGADPSRVGADAVVAHRRSWAARLRRTRRWPSAHSSMRCQFCENWSACSCESLPSCSSATVVRPSLVGVSV